MATCYSVHKLHIIHIRVHFQLPLRKELAKLFCQAVSRYPESADVQVCIFILRGCCCMLYYFLHIIILNSQYYMQYTIRKVLSREDVEKKYVVEACLKEANTFLSAFRSEERRRVWHSSYNYPIIDAVYPITSFCRFLVTSPQKAFATSQRLW